MEEKNIYWYDEKIPILKSLEKIFDEYVQNNKIIFPKLYKNEKEDLKMVDDLISSYLENKKEIENSLAKYTPEWDNDRITKIDYTLMLMALTEFRYMPHIPVKVSLNEYIEVAKMYSTPKSSKFINGTLDKILHDWNKQNLIHKKGRGLIG
jgi:N utilization substance protein B